MFRLILGSEMYVLPSRPEDLRRLLKRWVLDDPDRYLKRIANSQRVAERAGRAFECDRDERVLAEAIALAAAKMIRIRDITSQSLRRDRYYKNRKRWREGDQSVPGPDEWYGVRDWPHDTSYKVEVSGLRSERANEMATVSAIFLADDYCEYRDELKRSAKERDQAERDYARLAQLERKSATVTLRKASHADTGKLHRGKEKARASTFGQTACIVTPSTSVPSSQSLSQFTNWRTASEDQKAAAMARVIYDSGQGLAVTIDLSPEAVEQAKASRKTTMSHLRERFSKLLKRRLGYVPDMVLVGEQGFNQGPHIHGVIDLPDSPTMREAVRSAGVELSGLEKTGKASARIVDIQSLYDPEHWIGSYASKYRHSSRKGFDAKRVIVSTQTLSRRARERQVELKIQKGRVGHSKIVTIL
jgi:hypothetical protein